MSGCAYPRVVSRPRETRRDSAFGSRRTAASRRDMISRTRSSTRCCARCGATPTVSFKRAWRLLSWPDSIAGSFLALRPTWSPGSESELPAKADEAAVLRLRGQRTPYSLRPGQASDQCRARASRSSSAERVGDVPGQHVEVLSDTDSPTPGPRTEASDALR